MPLKFRQWLRDVLAQCKDKERGFKPLAAAITQANEHLLFERKPSSKPVRKKNSIDWRKLRAMILGDPYSYTLRDFEMLHNYLVLEGVRLDTEPLFEFGGYLLDTFLLAKGGVVVFGARPEDNRQDVSYWDVMSLQCVLEGNRTVSFQLMPDTLPPGETRIPRELRNLLANQATPVLGLGSPKSSPTICERLLRELLLGDSEKGRPSAVPDPNLLPFTWVWPPDPPDKPPLQSRFALDPNRLSDPEKRQAILEGKRYGFRWGPDCWLYPEVLPKGPLSDMPKNKSIKDVGCVVASVRGGRLKIVAAGASGPGTLIAIRAAKRSIPSTALETGKNARTLYAIYQTKVRLHFTETPGDPREDPKRFTLLEMGQWDPVTKEKELISKRTASLE